MILKNDVYANGGNGLELTAGNGSVVNHNNLYNNHQATWFRELVNGNGSSVNARFNYWGSAAATEMDGDNPKDISVIYDLFDDAGRGAVDYANWLGKRHDTACCVGF